MIGRLRRRMTLLVIGILILVSAGIVIAIYEVNNQNIISQAESALDALAENSGVRPSLSAGEMNPSAPEGDLPPAEMEEGQTPPPKPEGRSGEEGPDAPGEKEEGTKGSPPPFPAGGRGLGGKDFPGEERMQGFGDRRENRSRSISREEVASLSNSYTITIDAEGNIENWQSDRAELYSEETLQAFVSQVCESGKERGRIDTQFFRVSEQEDGTRLLIVLDARLEMMAGQRVLRAAALVASIACLALSLGAWMLIRKMVRPVEEAFQKQQQFVWDASHELKTPLAVISANADLLEAEIGENELLGYIRSEVRRTDSLVKNLLTLARMDKGTVAHEMTETDLSEAILEVLLPFESTVFEAGKTLDSEDIQAQVRIVGNRAMIQQLMVILLSNALKYSDDHGTIRVAMQKKNRGAEIRVMNTGDGIAEKDLERIFDRFYRTDASRNSETGGEGLGLAIARSIVEIHHGKIRAESEPGRSATFIVTLP